MEKYLMVSLVIYIPPPRGCVSKPAIGPIWPSAAPEESCRLKYVMTAPAHPIYSFSRYQEGRYAITFLPFNNPSHPDQLFTLASENCIRNFQRNTICMWKHRSQIQNLTFRLLKVEFCLWTDRDGVCFCGRRLQRLQKRLFDTRRD
jgi:hypothetical protein